MYTLSFIILSLLLVIKIQAQNVVEIRHVRPGEPLLDHTTSRSDLKSADSTIYYSVPIAYNRIHSPLLHSYYYPYYRKPVGYGYRPYVGLKAYLPYGVPLYG